MVHTTNYVVDFKLLIMVVEFTRYRNKVTVNLVVGQPEPDPQKRKKKYSY